MSKPKLLSDYTPERQYDQAGKPPTSVWTAVQLDDDGGTLVCLIGVEKGVDKVIRRLITGFRRRRLQVPSVAVTMENDHASVRIGVLFFGVWPTYAEARDIVRTIAGGEGDGPRQWAQRLRDLARQHPERVLDIGHRYDSDFIEHLASLYVEECRRVIGSSTHSVTAEKTQVVMVCPCGGKAIVTSDERGEPASLLHSMPMCEEYEKLEPDEYMRWLRGKREGRFDA